MSPRVEQRSLLLLRTALVVGLAVLFLVQQFVVGSLQTPRSRYFSSSTSSSRRGSRSSRQHPLYVSSQTMHNLLMLNRTQLCARRPITHKRLRQYCSNNLISYQHHIMHKGLAWGLRECRLQLRHRRFNCTFGHRFLDSGLPQSGYIWAISVSYAMLTLARECRLGSNLIDCRCRRSSRLLPSGMTTPDSDRDAQLRREAINRVMVERGCDDDHRGMSRIVRRFFGDNRATKIYRSFIDRINFHNRRVAHHIVRKSVNEFCMCIGTSGSCARKVCQLHMNSTRVKQQLSHLLTTAQLVLPQHQPSIDQLPLLPQKQRRGRGDRKRRRRRRRRRKLLLFHHGQRRVRRGTLVFSRTPPTYCTSDYRIGFYGNRGRVCPADMPAAVCRSVCCEQTRAITVYEKNKCHCKLHYTNQPFGVTCQICETQRRTSVCH